MRLNFTVIYINTDDYSFSEVVGRYGSYDDAVAGLLAAAHYDTDENGNLRQYRRPCDEYRSYDDLYSLVYQEAFLNDYDYYLIREDRID